MTDHEKRIREALEAVPRPHDWEVCQKPANEHWYAGRTIGAADPADGRRVADTCALSPHAETVATYIAACNPAAIRALLADLDEARAALTAAKAGGWVAVPVEAARLAGVALSEHPGHSPLTDWEDAAMKACSLLAARPLPNPPKEQS